MEKLLNIDALGKGIRDGVPRLLYASQMRWILRLICCLPSHSMRKHPRERDCMSTERFWKTAMSRK